MWQKQQISDTIIMVRPANFGFNEETASSNAFQSKESVLDHQQIQLEAIREFDAFVAKLRSAGVQVIVVEDTPDPIKTDAVFPNNWVTFHQNGMVVTYPMLSANRRLERRNDIIEDLGRNFIIRDHIHLEHLEGNNQFLEGTGSMIIDRQNGIVYACRSARTDEKLLRSFCKAMGYYPVLFDAEDENGLPIYHTNVMMALGEKLVVICLDSIKDKKEKNQLLHAFAITGKEVLKISYAQMNAFAGNMLQVKNQAGSTFLVMSEQAYKSLTIHQIAQIEQSTNILFSNLETIEKFGGGSARCMMAEVFLQKISG